MIYIGSHGSRRRVGDVRLDVLGRLLASQRDTMKRVEGLFISACDVFQTKSDLLGLTAQTGFRWAVSYSCAVGWFESMLVELATLNALAGQQDTAYRRPQARLSEFFRHALSLFNPVHPLEWTGTGTVAEHRCHQAACRLGAVPAYANLKEQAPSLRIGLIFAPFALGLCPATYNRFSLERRSPEPLAAAGASTRPLRPGASGCACSTML